MVASGVVVSWQLSSTDVTLSCPVLMICVVVAEMVPQGDPVTGFGLTSARVMLGIVEQFVTEYATQELYCPLAVIAVIRATTASPRRVLFIENFGLSQGC